MATFPPLPPNKSINDFRKQLHIFFNDSTWLIYEGPIEEIARWYEPENVRVQVKALLPGMFKKLHNAYRADSSDFRRGIKEFLCEVGFDTETAKDAAYEEPQKTRHNPERRQAVTAPGTKSKRQHHKTSTLPIDTADEPVKAIKDKTTAIEKVKDEIKEEDDAGEEHLIGLRGRKQWSKIDVMFDIIWPTCLSRYL